MVNWSDTRLEKLDKNDVKFKLWAEKRDFEYALCEWCMWELKYSNLGFQALV